MKAGGLASVLREEWLASVPRIKKTSITIAAIMLGAAAVNVGAYATRLGALTFFCIETYIAAFVCCAAIPVYALIAGGGNIRKVLFGESAPLMLLVPVRASSLLFGKQVINLAEYLIYAVQSFCYLMIMAPTGVFMWWALTPREFTYPIDVTDYWRCVSEFFTTIFRVEWRGSAHITLMCITAFVAVQATVNFASAVYSAFVHSNKERGKPSSFVMVIIIALLFYIPLRVGTLGIDRIVIERLDFAYRVWPYMARLCVFAAVYFALTAYLIERKVEVW